ncbi:MAG: cytochrome c oxidase assembly protein [Novosphingobium sp.]|nr:cytochrome c oxidase assembly protein [Novosphingobium sp.]
MSSIARSSFSAERNRRIAIIASLFALAMLGLGYAAVPLYRLFCQATGFNGTTQRATAAEAAAVRVAAGSVTVRFDSNVERGMPWVFHPEQTSQTMHLGARSLAFFIARNASDHPITGVASYNVEPEQAAFYFHKIQCFCFNQQTLQPHQQVRMPVIYYVDPKIAQDPDARDVQAITLSYTFHPVPASAAKPLDRSKAAG